MPLHEVLTREIVSLRDALARDGELLSDHALKACYGRFRERFGPEALARLDGNALLETMHAHGNRDSLVYWLEFKNDEELPAKFGSIAGGSALKFGIYRRKETGRWMTGTSQHQSELSDEEAVERARQHRQELIRGSEVLAGLPQRVSEGDYRELQRSLRDRAPTVAETAWGHKYFSLLFPEQLDDFHNPDYQRYQLIRLLQLPPREDGRYVAAGRFVDLTQELGMPMNHLTTALYRRNGNPRRYWRVGTSDPERHQTYWSDMRDGGFVAIGWPELGDLSGVVRRQEAKDALRSRVQTAYPGSAQAVGRVLKQVFEFKAHVQHGDVVLAADGERVLGIGRITGDYRFDPSHAFPHQRPVEWLRTDEWRMPVQEGLPTTFTEINKERENLVEVERRLLGAFAKPPGSAGPSQPVQPLPELVARIQAILDRKGQVILYGPPGTGKTYWAQVAARELAARYAFGRRFDELGDEARAEIAGRDGQLGLIRTVTFHPAYGYEDFLEGYRPALRGEQLVFEPCSGIFKQLCTDAAAHADRRFFLIIDEINRGDIPRIFGELLTILEHDKRGQPVLLGTSGEPFRVPPNVYILATMNTADRSIALLDAALRRRFGFVELMPDARALGATNLRGVPLGPWLDALNRRIREHAGRDARNLQIGHAYLLPGGRPVDDFGSFAQIMRDELIPLLEEYTYEDYGALEKILGRGLVDTERQRIREEVFDPAKHDTLVQCLLELEPEIATTPEAVAAGDTDEAPEQADADESDEDNRAPGAG